MFHTTVMTPLTKIADSRDFTPAPAAPFIPQEYVPSPLLMGEGRHLTAPGETLRPFYYALEEKRTRGLLCIVSPQCQAPVISLYGDVADAVMARKDWFRQAFSDVLYLEPVEGLISIREIPQAQALALRLEEALKRNGYLPVPEPRRTVIDPPLNGYWPVLVLLGVLAILAFVLHLP